MKHELNNKNYFLFFIKYSPHNDKEREKILHAENSRKYLFDHSDFHIIEINDIPINKTSAIINDPSPVPLLSEVVSNCIAKGNVKNTDVLIFINTDIAISPNFYQRIKESFRYTDALFSQRKDWDTNEYYLLSESEILNLEQFKEGIDCFAFTKLWLQNNFRDLPEMYIGRNRWDYILASQILITNYSSYRVPKDIIYHIKHNSYWKESNNFTTNPGNIWNRNASFSFFKRNPQNLVAINYFLKSVGAVYRLNF